MGLVRVLHWIMAWNYIAFMYHGTFCTSGWIWCGTALFFVDKEKEKNKKDKVR